MQSGVRFVHVKMEHESLEQRDAIQIFKMQRLLYEATNLLRGILDLTPKIC